MPTNKPLNISEEAAVQMPMKTVASLIIIVALGTMGYFQIVERLNIAADQFLYLVSQGTGDATYTAGRFLIEITGFDAAS